jgi:hypothetical protein
MFVLMGWASVLKLVELGDPSLDMQDRSFDMPIIRKQAKECIMSCALLLGSSEETLSRRNLGTQLMLWA